ncbi:unnamed protein product [Brassica oleracea var. botrytis]
MTIRGRLLKESRGWILSSKNLGGGGSPDEESRSSSSTNGSTLILPSLAMIEKSFLLLCSQQRVSKASSSWLLWRHK